MKKSALPAAIIAAAFTFGVPATLNAAETVEDDLDFASSAFELSPAAAEPAASYSRAVGFEFFGALGEEEFCGEDVWLVGLSMRYTISQNIETGTTEKLSPEFFILGNLGGGYINRDDPYEEFVEIDHWSLMGILGANLRYHVGDVFSVYVGARAGIDFASVSDDENEDSDIGWVYGVGVGCDLRLSERVALTFGADYLTTAAAPKLSGAEFGNMSYTFYSGGLKILF